MKRLTRKERAAARRGCEGKRRYESETEAYQHMTALRKKDGARVNYYACPLCEGFHVGHTPRRVRQSIRDRAS